MGADIPSVVIHGHFYQPPREDPWSDGIEREPSAAPFHDWNERIERECYRAVTAARRHGAGGRIADIVNLLASISFDFGPTLLEWLERRAPNTYQAMLEADRLSRAANGGHGNAIAMPYHHIILPLASRRDKVTEVRWGIADFRRRFGREPSGLWLPETALDAETLDVIAAEGIAFTVVAPHQVKNVPPRGLPGRYRTTGGRTIALFPYDGDLSHGVAFGGLLHDAEGWARSIHERRAAALVAMATDGETYGHHHPFGELALAWLLHALRQKGDVRVENFASFLARHPPRTDVRLVEPTSWSCAHGVERWRADCGCRTKPGTQQTWRAPLREGLNRLAEALHAIYQREAADLLGDPWAARDDWGAEMNGDETARARFALTRARRKDAASLVRARELLELERCALGMFTSCGWFFDDVAGIETVQVLRYAVRAIELAGESRAGALESGLLDQLARARGNDETLPTGREVYARKAKPPIAPAARAAAGHAALKRLAPDLDPDEGSGYRAGERDGRLVVTHGRTGRESAFRVSVGSASGHHEAHLVVEVAPEDGGSAARVGLDDLFDHQRGAAASRVRRLLAERTLRLTELAPLAAGTTDLAHIATRTLLSNIESLRQDRSPAALAAVMDLAELIEMEVGHIPFDAQTAFHRVRSGLEPAAAASLAEVAWRLGFVAETATASGDSGAGTRA